MRVLFIESDKEYLSDYMAEMEKEYVVDVAYTASEGAYYADTTDYDAIVIDYSLPDQNGSALCNSLKVSDNKPSIVMLGDKDDAEHRIKCLGDGAHVYLQKKVTPKELTGQISALVKLKYNVPSKMLFNGRNLYVDLNCRKIISNGTEIYLRKKEFGILEHLLMCKHRVVSKEELLEHIWEPGILVESNTLEVHMRNLRAKIEKTSGVKVIDTHKGIGYRINPAAFDK